MLCVPGVHLCPREGEYINSSLVLMVKPRPGCNLVPEAGSSPNLSKLDLFVMLLRGLSSRFVG